jgi:hypothetical protein
MHLRPYRALAKQSPSVEHGTVHIISPPHSEFTSITRELCKDKGGFYRQESGIRTNTAISGIGIRRAFKTINHSGAIIEDIG